MFVKRNVPLWIGLAMLPVVSACVAGGQSSEVGAHRGYLGEGSFEQVDDFGDNPGNLRMYRYVPSPEPSDAAPLVVALHACSQDASTFRNVGWEALADEHGFYVLYPEQKSDNNPINCFNWAGEYGDDTNLRRGEGENQSIKEMIDRMKADFAVDSGRIFAMGHSAGAAETAVMLATWPDVFAAGGIIAGVPYRCATSQDGAYTCQLNGRDKTPEEWGTLVREAYTGYDGPYPRVSLWHGTGDGIVVPANTRELVDQWTHVHGVDQDPEATDMVAGYPHEEHHDGSGTPVVERYEITGKGHATFVDPDNGCGSTGSYITDAGICSAKRMADFFGLTGDGPGDGEGGGSDGEAGDDTAPTVDMIQPSEDDVVAGETTVRIDASDDGEIDRVDLEVDGMRVARMVETPYEHRWDTTTTGDGMHTLTAVAWDAAGNGGRVDTTVTVRNARDGSGADGPRGSGGSCRAAAVPPVSSGAAVAWFVAVVLIASRRRRR